VNIILADLCDLRVTALASSGDAGIEVASGKSLAVYAQSGGSGKLTVKGGGTDSARGGAGIGGGDGGDGSTVSICGGTATISGGTVTAPGGSSGGPVIGGGNPHASVNGEQSNQAKK
jgi:hypothetical protein